MRQTTDPEAIRLCNGCAEREKQRKVEVTKDDNTIGLLVKCPKKTYKEIEEYCVNNGLDFTKYFLSLHESFHSKGWVVADDALLDKPTGYVDVIFNPETDEKPHFIIQQDDKPKIKGKKK